MNVERPKLDYDLGDKMTGIISIFHGAKGFGFIDVGEGMKDLFVHRTNLIGNIHSVKDASILSGTEVEFEVGVGRRPNSVQGNHIRRSRSQSFGINSNSNIIPQTGD